MKLVLCPRCELNYITGKDPFCRVCMQEMQGRTADEPELCSICNENPVLPGRDICAACLSEMNADSEPVGESEEQTDRPVETGEIGEIEPVTEMEDILPDDKDAMGKEYGTMENPLSLEDIQEQEKENEEEDEDGEEL